MIDLEEFTKDCRALFATPLGRDVLQGMLEYAGNNEAGHGLPNEELRERHGARALALDIATMAGVLPEIPGSKVARAPVRHDTALDGRVPPEGEAGGQAPEALG